MAQLDAGIPAEEIVQTLANIRHDKPNPLYYAHRTVDIANAVRWVRTGFDFESRSRKPERTQFCSPN